MHCLGGTSNHCGTTNIQCVDIMWGGLSGKVVMSYHQTRLYPTIDDVVHPYILLAQLICMGAYVTFIVETIFQLRLCLSGWKIKNIVIFMKFNFQNDGGVKRGVVTF